MLPEPFTTSHFQLIAALAAQHRLPAVYPYRFFAVGGGLLSYGVDVVGQYRQAGVYTGRVLKGAKPADLPVVQSTRFEFVINLSRRANVCFWHLTDKSVSPVFVCFRTIADNGGV